MDLNRIGFPKKFTVSVIGQAIVKNRAYYRVANYFVPGPTLPDTILLRNAGDKVFVRFGSEQDEYRFYSFSPLDTTWSVPMYANPSTLYPRMACLAAFSENTATIAWDWNGRSEGGWQEIFQSGYGRTEIFSVSQAYGKVVWRLENI